MEQRLDMLATKRKEPNSTFSPSPTSTRCCDGELDVYQATQGHTVPSAILYSYIAKDSHRFADHASSPKFRARCKFRQHSPATVCLPSPLCFHGPLFIELSSLGREPEPGAATQRQP